MSCSKKSLEENHLDEKIDFVEFIKSTQKLDLCDTESCQSLTSKHSNEEKLKYPFEKEEVMKDYRKFSEDTIRVGKIINPKKLFKSSKTCSVFNAIESIDGKETSESKRYSNSNPGILNEENDNIKDEGKKNKSGCCQKGVTKVGSEKRYSNHHAPMKTMHTVDHEDGSIEAYFTEDITYNK